MHARKTIVLMVSGMLLTMAGLVSAAPGAPNFMPAIYGDGEVWGTKGTTPLPAPNAKNLQSFDNLYVFTNANDPNAVQLPVSEAAPGNPKYNGRRRDSWHTVAMHRYWHPKKPSCTTSKRVTWKSNRRTTIFNVRCCR